MRDGNKLEEGVQDVKAPGKKCLVESVAKVELGRKKIRVGMMTIVLSLKGCFSMKDRLILLCFKA